MMQARALEPYAPPIQWLQMANGGGWIFKVAWPWIKDNDNYTINAIVKASPILTSTSELFHEENRKHFVHLLDISHPDPKVIGEDSLDAETRIAYEITLSYIGWIYQRMQSGEHNLATCRRLVGFAPHVPKKFIEMVEQHQPRALIILAHYFALAAKLEYVWWIGETARREVLGIRSILQGEWHDLMHWPFEIVESR
ncbi:MAG: hypothetical protein MMC33_002553 [Icmadophila ericetorum]|nr:hypothetical protein [Icmadophila ericetorum]